MNKNWKKYVMSAALATAVVGAFSFATRDDFGLGRAMEQVVGMMRELSVGYVDPVDADKLLQGAAEGMVRDLDPYTEYIAEDAMQDFELLTTGKYGGMGSLIRKKGDWICIAQPYKGSPSDRAGMKIGDKILSIDGKSAEKFTNEQVSSRLKGTPGSVVSLELERLDGSRYKADVVRERILIPSVPYYGWLNDSTAYLCHRDFIDGSYVEIRNALDSLNRGGRLRNLVLDLRFNGGGIMQEAVKILSLFVPKGTEVLSTKGRTEASKKSYATSSEPAYPDLRLAVLINNGSASASEIVSGALQDLDRAVLLGQRSFGKGLVQTTVPLGYNGMLKLTTAKYYIPSGRCIQAVDYSHSQEGTVKVVPDSLISEFATAGGRKVYDGGGLMPDIKTEPEYVSRFAATLFALGFIADYGDEYMIAHPELKEVDSRTFTITDADYEAFRLFMKDKKVPYESETRQALKMLKKATDEDRFKELGERIAQIEKELKDDTASNIDTYRKEIVEYINRDIIQRFNYQEGAMEYGVVRDREVDRAVELLSDVGEYERILREQDTPRK